MRLGLRCYGLPIALELDDPELLTDVLAVMPPGARPCDPALARVVYRVYDGSDGFGFDRDGKELAHALPRADGLDTLKSNLALYIAERSPRRVFIHAGAVAWKGQGIILPGRSWAGKSTLVAALVRAGATFYSDEYAVFDARGRLHSYPRAIALRDASGKQTEHLSGESIGKVGRRSVPVGLVLSLVRRDGGRWSVKPVTAAQGVLELLGNAVAAQTRTVAVLTALEQIVAGARVLKGRRGEAVEAAPRILALCDALSCGPASPAARR